MGVSIRACSPLLVLLLAATVGAQQVPRTYLTPTLGTGNNPNALRCPPDQIITTTRTVTYTDRITSTLYATRLVVSTVTSTQQVLSTAVRQVQRVVTVTRSVRVPSTQISNVVVYVTSTAVLPAVTNTVQRTSYVQSVAQVVRTSRTTAVTTVVKPTLRVVTVVETVTSRPPPPPRRTVFVTRTVTVPGPAVTVPVYRTVRSTVVNTVPSPNVVSTVFQTKYVTNERVVERFGPNVERTRTVQEPVINYVTSTVSVPRVSRVVVDVTQTDRQIITNYQTSTVYVPVNVVSTQVITNYVTQTRTSYVTRPVVVTTTRTAVRTSFQPDVVRTIFSTVTSVLNVPGPQRIVTSYSTKLQIDTNYITSTVVVQKQSVSVVEVPKPCDGYDYKDKGNPLGL
ncbi:agglutinin-like protein ARB_02240 isoform X2 [Pollicipes pollicipes]|uniref:agglutinin-like protein ARB_02240 isoform X2 n=1 Tax=Pollicipes pollicipes TaxID=41117 RepID=UPI0018850E41|nr:agglutinin-like protein ARB_02240 isoform X2 [Pollicipes pollicipes]